MDPTATLADFLTLLTTGQIDDALDTLRDLDAWLSNGGFAPDVTVATEAAGIVTR